MISDRIEALIAHFCNGNKSLFAQKIGVTPSVIGNLTGERKGNPSFEVIQKVLDAFASVNPDWFILDRGSMLRDSKNPEESKLGCTPIATPISPAEESIIYKMYKDEKDEKERMLKEKDILLKDKESKIDHLQSELRSMAEELATYRAKYSPSNDIPLAFTPGSSEGYTPSSDTTIKPPKSSKRSSAGKI